MRPYPVFPSWRGARVPKAKRWWVAASMVALAVGGGSAILRKAQVGNGIIIAAMLFSFLVVGTLWLFRLWYYRGAVLNARAWEQEVALAQQQWWLQHRQPFGLQEVVLIGPAGSDLSEWGPVLRRDALPPQVRDEQSGGALRIARTFSANIDTREQQLARMLVLQWEKQHKGQVPRRPKACYWAGTDIAWRQFVQQAKEIFTEIKLPSAPQQWRGEETLAEISALLAEEASDVQVLVAGCQSLSTSSQSLRPAGESAVLWLVGAKGPVLLTRGEIYEPATNESILQVCQRAQMQSEIDEIPECCMLFSHPEHPELASGGWNVTQHQQDKYWGDTGEMEALIVISLAAIFAQTQQSSCGWIATNPLNTLTLGIVKAYG